MVQEVQGLVLVDEHSLGGSTFGIFRFIPIQNGNFACFLIFYEVRTFGSVEGLVFFGKFGGSKFDFRG